MTENRFFRPLPDEASLKWAGSAPTAEGEVFRTAAIAHNMMAQSQIGRSAFVVIETEQGERMIARPPLTAGELMILSKVPYFREILKGIVNG